MNLNEIIDLQKKFDSRHKGRFDWDQKIDDSNIDVLEYLLLCVAGELGETANLIKKVVRGDYLLDKIKSELSEEVTDIFIYVIKLAYQLDIDLEKQFLEKQGKNKERFINFEKNRDDM